MKRSTMGFILASSLLLAGCGGASGGGTLDITENGAYDVSGYDQVVVHVGEGEGVAAEQEPQQEAVVQDLGLVRVQFKHFSMDVPGAMVEGYTEAELTENESIYLSAPGVEAGNDSKLTIHSMDLLGSERGLGDFTDAPQEDVNGITMGVKHEHLADQRNVQVTFIHGGFLYQMDLFYPVAQDELYAEYADQFYRTIQMN